MSVSDENNPGVIGASQYQGGLHAGERGKLVAATGQNRRALSTINRNLIEGPPFPCAVSKRPLSERNAVCDKIPPIPQHRPITRKFAAQMANKQQMEPEEIKKPIQSVPDSNEDCSIIDVDNSDVPMFVQHTEAMMEEIERMCTGCVPPNYMEQQYDINQRMRGILIDWLVEVHYKFELMEETLYLTINLIDRFLAVKQIARKKLQLVGVTAMLLACKYEEVSVPVIEDLVLISDKAYSRQEVLDMEKLMINTLQFNLSVPTPYVFMRRFLKAAQSNKKLELLSFFMIELCLVEYEMLRFPPSLLAAAAIFTAQCSLSGCKYWSKTSEWYTTYSEEQLMECSRMMVRFHQKAGTGKLTGVQRKYSTSKYGYAAKIEAPTFLLES
ncbi:hypothetical protein GOBAR_DD26885 [Gossypium barbadense]|nr:hypothetical protein GOBAR_DD26885 [Gossypium barbadense]